METKFNPQLSALKIALKNMFNGEYFNICTIESCLKLTNSILNTEVYKIMRTVHCVNFKDMDSDFRKWIFEQTILTFNANGFDFSKIEIIDNKNSTLFITQ